MMYKKEAAVDGNYHDASGARYILLCCRRIRTKDGINVGWTEFATIDDCLEAWGLDDIPLD